MNGAPRQSTPIAQLPMQQQQQQQQQLLQQQLQLQQHQAATGGGGVGGGGGAFVNEPHRQIVAQAQHAAQNYAMPQPTSHDPQLMMDDDATVREATHHFMQSAMEGPPPPPPPPGPIMGLQEPLLPSYFPITSTAGQSMGGGGGDGPSWTLPGLADARIALLGAIVYIMVSMLPVQGLLERFASPVASFPFAEVIVKAVCVGIALLIGNNII
jgi:hypothetical protein